MVAALAQATAALAQQNATQSHLRGQVETLRSANQQLQSRLNGVESSLESYRMAATGYAAGTQTPLTQAAHPPIVCLFVCLFIFRKLSRPSGCSP